ncbi:MAG TPA: alpha-amylase family glycosyl hydrolase [Sphaerochaeta sp.]|nr:alpha-amylase family glycosyl hydrolase [Sphaerochaeta sp.]
MKHFKNRWANREGELLSLWASLYNNTDLDALFALFQDKAKERKPSLKALDTERIKNPLWYLGSEMSGQMLYVDKFNRTFRGLEEKIPYLTTLEVHYLHLMPCMKMPPTKNDGGYAVEDFTAFDPRLGDSASFVSLADACRKEHISLCLDFVLNHCADTHTWAKQAKEGKQSYRDRFFFVKDKSEVDSYEATTNEVFPQQAPGNFTYLAETDEYVMTTFNHFQWDLNYGNSDVLLSMLEAMLSLANYGVEVFRFDAIPYIWKRWGTSNRNLPEVHTLLRIFRLALEIVAPLCIIKGEVVMAPREVAPYFGTEKAPECHLLYNVSLMVQMWNSLATRDTRLLQKCLSELPTDIPSSACWVNYLRCHDDIGWGIEDEHLYQLGFSPFEHKQFLISFYEGTFPGSFSRGELYEFNDKNKDARNCGTSASLCGLEKALEEKDSYQKELALKRLALAHVFVYLTKGISVLYSGDEIATLNDYSYRNDPILSKDSRNLHRPMFNWNKSDDASDFLFTTLQEVIGYRSLTPDFRSDSQERVIPSSDVSVFALKRGKEHLVLVNFSEYQKSVQFNYTVFGSYREVFSQRELILGNDPFILGPYQYLLLKRM